MNVTVGGGDNDSIVNIENLVGSSGDDTLGGDLNDNRLEGLAGADRFIASDGADTFIGGTGLDTLDYSNFFAAGSIAVTLQGDTQSTVVVAGTANDTVAGVENVVGTTGDDTIIGDDQDNILEGGAGDDTLDGGLGTDSLIGGAGDDTITASVGADNTDGGAGVDTVDFSTLTGGQSIDVTLDQTNVTTVIINNGTNQTITAVENIVGTVEDDRIEGDTAENNLQASGGDDVLIASASSDVMDGGSGVDTVDYSTLAGVSRITATLNGATPTTVQVTGGSNDTISNIENIFGTAGNDTCLLYTSPSPRDKRQSRMPSSA